MNKVINKFLKELPKNRKQGIKMAVLYTKGLPVLTLEFNKIEDGKRILDQLVWHNKQKTYLNLDNSRKQKNRYITIIKSFTKNIDRVELITNKGIKEYE